jgi:hypothetical protein
MGWAARLNETARDARAGRLKRRTKPPTDTDRRQIAKDEDRRKAREALRREAKEKHEIPSPIPGD